MRCIETMPPSENLKCLERINYNMRCIETAIKAVCNSFDEINYNMRCIETAGWWKFGNFAYLINYNMRCIETIMGMT